MTPTRPPLKYFGSKWRLAPWIILHFPQHECYVEPFCGGAGVFLRKPPSTIEVLNDLDGEIVNFFRVLREQTREFIQAIETTPYSRQEYDQAWELRGSAASPLEQARRFYIRIWQGWGSTAGSKSGWGFQSSNGRGRPAVADWNATTHLTVIAERLKNALIEHDDALNVIERYDNPRTLFYCDPPYLAATRSARWQKHAYHCGVDEDYHYQLLLQLRAIQGMAIISGYPSDLYNDLLRDWARFETTARTTNTPNVAREVIWVSPAAVAHGQGMLW